VEFLVNAVHFLFPKFDYSWLVEEIKDSLPKVRLPNSSSTMSHICSHSIFDLQPTYQTH
jgi:hypothetical protein